MMTHEQLGGLLNEGAHLVDYVLDQSGAQMNEVTWLNGIAVTQHTNVTANGTLFASLDSEGWHFHLNDPLGSRRL